MTKYKEVYARAVGSTPQEQIVEILDQAGISLRISSWEDVTITMVSGGLIIVDENGAYLDMLNSDAYGPHTPLGGPEHE